MERLAIEKENWDKILDLLSGHYQVFAAVKDDFGLDYELLTNRLIPKVVYNRPKPATPLKYFFLPVREDVTVPDHRPKPRIIMGIPNCDLVGLELLDEIFLSGDFPDLFYGLKRDNTLLISSDCFSTEEHCHCTSYGVEPFNPGKGDLSVTCVDGWIVLTAFSDKGRSFISETAPLGPWKESDSGMEELLAEKHMAVQETLNGTHRGLPDYRKTGELVAGCPDDIWKKYASDCVSCGACAVICPTCSCFLLMDRPGFEKVRQVDACQYPGFARVAGGEDSLRQKEIRFRNRYFCKYVWRPERFSPVACTGCGRCIEACIGKISKNELFEELANSR